MVNLIGKLVNGLGDFSSWSPCNLDDLDLGDSNTDTTEEKEACQEIKDSNKLIMIDTDTGDVIGKDGDELSENEWELLADKYQENTENEEALWMTIPENAEEMIEYQKYVSNSVRQKEVIDLLRLVKNEDYFSILNLSMYAVKLYDDGEHKKANKKVQEIGGQYGSKGRHIHNLYSAGYFERIAEEYEQKKDEDMSQRKKAEIVENSIRNLMDKPIHFVPKHTDLDEDVADINREIERGEEMIAIHGIGEQSIVNVTRILTKTVHNAYNQDYDVTVSHEPKTHTLELKVCYMKH